MAHAGPTTRGTVSEKDSLAVILTYLSERGHTKAEAALRQELVDAANAAGAGGAPRGGGRAVDLEDFAARNVPSAPSRAAAPSAPGKRRADQAAAGGQLLADPPSWAKGYEGLRTFVHNSLDIHRPELHPLLLPLFVHSYLDLVLSGYREAADHFLDRFAADHITLDPHIVRMLSSIRLPEHVNEAEAASRWRSERYNLRISERGWGLLLGWLQGGGIAGSIEGTDSRGRDRVLAIINERVKVDAIPGPPARSATDFGLPSDLGLSKQPKGLQELKLGPVALDSRLEREVQRAAKEQTFAHPIMTGASELSMLALPMSLDSADQEAQPAAAALLVSPQTSETLPYPANMRSIDVAREVERVREGRKRIKLGGEAFYLTNGAEPSVTGAAKPSVCIFTLHDTGDCLNTTTFSEDSSLMAAGFSESYIRLWNLKGGKLPGLRSDFDSDDITDAASLKSLRTAAAPTSRKLIGHSGPVYALSFDPVPGASAPPRYLLSASQDTTIRLWSLETYSNLMAYRGHREPVWDVQWGPKGIYFATASRDRTARLWTTDKISAIRIFAGHLSDVNCVRFHPNSLYIATGSSDRTCRLWDVQKGTCVRVFVGHRGSVTALAISPDGRYLASGAEDLSVILWDLSSGKAVKSMTGHTSSINSLSFSLESTVLVSGSSDGTVRVWDVLAAGSTDDATSVRKYGERAEMGLAQKLKRGSAVGGASQEAEGKSGMTMGLLPKPFLSEKEVSPSSDLLTTLVTKRTPILNVHFTPRNLCLASGPMFEPSNP